VIAGLIYVSGTAFSTVVAVYIGYRAFGLVLRFLGLVAAVLFTVASIVILIIIILILIF
jgi:chromate transport protein ChrA